MTKSKIPIEALWKEYQRTKSVWATAKSFGLAGQTVHERLVKNGYMTDEGHKKFTKEEDEAIKMLYSLSIGVRELNLKNFAKTFGRSHTSISRRARELGLTSATRKLTTNQRDNISKIQLLSLQQGQASRSYTTTEKGWFESSFGARYYMKSGWEIKYANYLEMLLKGRAISSWEYEPETFWFEKIRRGVRSYTPDFKITYRDRAIEYHEVKGYMDPRSKTKIKRMKIYHPQIKLIVITKPELKALGLI